ncbi:MAG: HpaII family restriction endonuclease [Clostridiales Family XIII bacterium]|jgi:hypothetical protein|nr:HpaII family restriction endonuclease [Clostridiales Family XIII bacterium]
MAIKGNKGEWSEVYALLRLLADGKLFAADERPGRISNMFFPILKILREEVAGSKYEYHPDPKTAEVRVYLNDDEILKVPMRDFDSEATRLFNDINNRASSRGSFELPQSEAFIKRICVNKLKAPSSDKADISIQVHDVSTSYEHIVGFSIKSELGMPPTLLNAGKTTNFIFAVKGLDPKQIKPINAIDTDSKIKDRMRAIAANGSKLQFRSLENQTFNDNLVMIDSQMPVVVSQMLIGYYSETANDCAKLADYVTQIDPLSCSAEFYRHKVKELLCAIALGLKPATQWDGTDEATGGYIIVKTDGDVLAYHIYNRDAFRGYLLNNTKFETGSSTRHGFGVLYREGGEIRIKLNLQIRFV